MKKYKQIIILLLAVLYIQIVLIFALKTVIVNLNNIRGTFFNESRLYKHALRHYERALILDSKNLYALIWAGYIYEDIQNPAKAEQYYKRVIEYHPDRNEGYFFMGVLKLNQDNAQAYQLFLKAAERDGTMQEQALKFVRLMDSRKK
ncbi:hypothetical protein ACFL96_04445 [Thermoproteota archaeon]